MSTVEFNSDGTIKEVPQPLVSFNPKTGITTRVLVQTLPTRKRKLTKTQRKALKSAMREPWQETRKTRAMAKGYKAIMTLLGRGSPVRTA